MLWRHFQITNTQGDADKLLFRGLSSTKQGYRLRSSGGVSYTRVWELVLEKVKELGLGPKQFGLHSLRSGGASATENAGVPDAGLRGMAGGSQRMPRMATSGVS